MVTLKVIEDAILTDKCSYLHFTTSSLPNLEWLCCFVEVGTKRRGGRICVYKYPHAWCNGNLESRSGRDLSANQRRIPRLSLSRLGINSNHKAGKENNHRDARRIRIKLYSYIKNNWLPIGSSSFNISMGPKTKPSYRPNHMEPGG